MFILSDQTGQIIQLPSIPQRIVSLVPSQTELLYHLGLVDEVVGITKFCIHPQQWFKNKQRIGGTKNVNIDLVRSLQPDLVIANKEENVQEQVEAISQFAPVWVSDVNNLEDALKMIRNVGLLVGRQAEATDLIKKIFKAFETLKHSRECFSREMPDIRDERYYEQSSANNGSETEKLTLITHNKSATDLTINGWKNEVVNQPILPGEQLSFHQLSINKLKPSFGQPPTSNKQLIRTAYLIWKDPFMTVGGDTYIHDMISHCGLQNIFEQSTRYPTITIDQLTTENCQLLLLSSEPYPFRQKHIDELQLQLPQTTIKLVDGEMFSWYGSRLLLAAKYLEGLITTIRNQYVTTS